MLGLSLSPDVTMEIEVQAAKVYRLTAQRGPLDLLRLRDETAELQAQIAEATSLERRTLGQRRSSARRRRLAEPAPVPLPLQSPQLMPEPLEHREESAGDSRNVGYS